MGFWEVIADIVSSLVAEAIVWVTSGALAQAFPPIEMVDKR
jgi:hypothetical protein